MLSNALHNTWWKNSSVRQTYWQNGHSSFSWEAMLDCNGRLLSLLNALSALSRAGGENSHYYLINWNCNVNGSMTVLHLPCLKRGVGNFNWSDFNGSADWGTENRQFSVLYRGEYDRTRRPKVKVPDIKIKLWFWILYPVQKRPSDPRLSSL